MPASADEVIRIVRQGRAIVGEVARFQQGRGVYTLLGALAARAFYGVEVSSYLMLGLRDRPMRTWPDTLTYYHELEPGLRSINWRGEGRRLTVDKVATAERLFDMGIASPTLLAIVGRDRTKHPHQDRFSTATDVNALAKLMRSWPDEVFIKPAQGWRADGIFSASRASGRWIVDHRNLTNKEFANLLIGQAPPSGLLVQERLHCHPALSAIGGSLGLGTVRLNTALTSTGAEVVFGFAKIMGSECPVDNFAGGKFGNMLARLNTKLGTVGEVFGRDQGQRFLMHEVHRHPITGTLLKGFQLPLWDEVLNLVKKTSAAFAEAPLIGADIAITADGPVVIEVQSDWDANGAQLMIGGGLRPLIAEILPRLQLPSEVKLEAAEIMGLTRKRSVRRKIALEQRS